MAPSTSPLISDRRHAQAQEPTPTDDSKDSESQSSPKRKSSEAATEYSNGDSGKKKRRKVNHACVYCRRSHMTCDLERPCARCIKRDIGHLCHDEPRDPPKSGKSMDSVPEFAPASEEGGRQDGSVDAQFGDSADFSQTDGGVSTTTPQLAQMTPISPAILHRPQAVSRNSGGGGSSGDGNPSAGYNFTTSDWNNAGIQNQFQDMHHLHPNYMFNTSEVSNEYNLLNDFLSSSMLDDDALYTNDNDPQNLFNDPLFSNPSFNNPNNDIQPLSVPPHPLPNNPLPPPPLKPGEEISRPSSAPPADDTRAREKFYLTAADPAGLSSAEDRLHKLLKAKYDAGMLRPFNYVKGYARLATYMSQTPQSAASTSTPNVSRDSQLRILKQLERFRPKFREAMHALTDMQLVLAEMAFERSLYGIDRVFASMAIPACCWRRTGEIFRGNREMAELIGVSMERLREGRLGIWEIMQEGSLVSYWEKFGAIAFDGSQKAILTSCWLKSPAGGLDASGGGASRREGEMQRNGGQSGGGIAAVRCCFSFTIRRDMHNIPSLIVGNFLPVRPRVTNEESHAR